MMLGPHTSIRFARNASAGWGTSIARWTMRASIVAAMGCAPENPNQDTAPFEVGAPTVEIHSGLFPYASVQSSDTVPIEFGPQGGFHVSLAAKTRGIDPGSSTLELGLINNDLAMVTWEVIAPDGMISSEVPKRSVANTIDETGVLHAPQVVVLRYFENPPAEFSKIRREWELEAMSVEIRVLIEDAVGNSAAASLQGRVDFPHRKGQADPGS